MLRPEVAEKRLHTFRVKDATARRLRALSALPGPLAEAGRGILGRNAAGKSIGDWSKRNQAREKAVQTLEGLKPAERQKVFAALFPRLARHLEAAWQLYARLPYEVDGERKGFRAPTEPALAREARAFWLDNVLDTIEDYDPDIAWCAAWAPHLGYVADDALGVLLAAAIDAGGAEGDEVFDILRQSATNEHEVGSMGRHVTRALLVCSRPAGWEFVEKLLLAARRQEGLRQVILETVDEAHPEAFRRMLRLILEEDLVRFRAVIRAVDVWFGLAWESLSARLVKEAVSRALLYLEDRQARARAIATEKGEALYLALWSLAFEDARTAVTPASQLLTDPDVERRFVAVHFLHHLELPAAKAALVPALEDADLRVALRALDVLTDGEERDLFEPLEKLLARMPAKPTELPALVWPWATTSARRADVADRLPDSLGKRSPTLLLPYLPQMGGYARGQVAELLGKQKTWDDATREALFSLVGDRDSWVREHALRALKKCPVGEAEAQRLEGYLTRKGSNMRQAVLKLLKKQKGAAALASADRLLAARKAEQRLGGLELLRVLVEAKRNVAECRQRAERYREGHPQLSEQELPHVEAVLDIHRVVPTLDDALGLMDPAQRSPAVLPQVRKVTLLTPATLACLQALDELIERHKEEPVTVSGYEGQREELLGNLSSWEFPSPDAEVPAEKDAERLPLRAVWEGWYAGRPKAQRDKDGLDLVRASAWREQDPKSWKAVVKRFGGQWGDYLKLATGELALVKLKHEDLVGEILTWLLRLHPPARAVDFLLDAVETGFALVPQDARTRVVNLSSWEKRDRDWRMNSPVQTWLDEALAHRRWAPSAWDDKQRLRLWQLLHWRDQPAPGVARVRPELEHLLAGFKAGSATEADVYDQLLGPRAEDNEGFGDLDQLTALPPPKELEDVRLREIVDRCRERVLEVELARGENPTAATAPARSISALMGLDTLLRLLRALGKKPFARPRWFVDDSRPEVLTQLIGVTHPGPADTPEVFAARMKEAGQEERLLPLAFQAPQWLEHVEHALGWEGLREGVWWFLAHMPGGRPGVAGAAEDEDFDFEDEEVKVREEVDPWQRLLRERTPLTVEERRAGGVDVAWFHRAHGVLGPQRWQALAAAAKFGCSDMSYKKAALVGDVLLGRTKKTDLVAGIRDKRLKESVRLLGLLPLAEGEKREADLLGRWKVLQEYRRYARALGPLSREGAVQAYEVGIHNLARTAGYPDPIRLEWALEAREIADLAAGPISVSHEGVTVTLALDEQAQAQVTVRRGDKPLKSIPAPVRKHPKVAALTERKAELRRQASRMKGSLEQAMCRGDEFTGTELRQLAAHPVLRPLLERLVLLGEGIRGYSTAAGQALTDHAGKVEPIKPEERLRIAHPHDLLSAGDWDRWQHDCFARERVQPFKQVFRELYVVTAQERKDGAVSHRYAGQQVNPNQAMALWGGRGWATRDGVSRTFHDVGLTAEVTFRHHGWTPLQVEGLTLEGVQFLRKGEWQPLPLKEVPPRVFSEVMRDVDLVVSVAHLGGVDPEASASTVEMRAALLRETCSLLKVDNYRIKGSHVVIDGKLNRYTVHLGSAVVHRQPGGSLCIVPVHAQHRGRLFLPFADDDPRTAEVLSKVLLLARDDEIQDPSILEQLR
jgi:hypothetical protein